MTSNGQPNCQSVTNYVAMIIIIAKWLSGCQNVDLRSFVSHTIATHVLKSNALQISIIERGRILLCSCIYVAKYKMSLILSCY